MTRQATVPKPCMNSEEPEGRGEAELRELAGHGPAIQVWEGEGGSLGPEGTMQADAAVSISRRSRPKAELTTKPLSFFKPDPSQPRKRFDEASLRALGESLRVRQNEPLEAKSDGTIINGERRWRAAVLVGLSQLDVIITEEPLTEVELNLARLTTFVHREDLTAFEKWAACRQILDLNPGWAAKDLAQHLHVDPSMVTRLLSPSKCTPAWQEALKAGTVGISDVYAASKLPESEQPNLLAMKLSGASRDAIEHAGRKHRAAEGPPSVKVNRVRCLLPSGVQVVVSGASVSLEESIEALSQATREMRRARELGYTSKTFAAAMKDKAQKK